jgi:hypothetical protein
MIILAIFMAFAWAIGGEKYFGKWRRGVLVAALSVVIGFAMQITWWGIGLLAAMFYIYQLLFYDDGIKAIWGDANLREWVGWAILLINGWICGLYPFVIWGSQGDWMKGLLCMSISGFAFCFICWLSNGLKWSWNGCYRIKEVGIWCPGDAWWWACWIYGLILGGLSIW